jgi:hypothetical protein
MTAEELRAKYGAAQGRKFTVSPGFEIVVEQDPDGHIRSVELPGTAPDQTGATTAERVDEALLELVPMSMRGKEIGFWLRQMPYSTKHTSYEHVVIVENEDPWVPGQRRSVTVLFRDHHQSSSTS